MSNYHWIVNIAIPVIVLLYVSAVHVPFEVLPICFTCFYTGNYTEVTPWGPMTCSRTAMCTCTLWQDKVPLPYTDSWVQPKCRAAFTSMVLLLIYSAKARTNYLQLRGSAKLLSGAPEGRIGKFHVQNNWKLPELSRGFLNCRFARTSRECKDRKLLHVGFMKSSVEHYEKDSPETSNDHIH